MSRLSHRKQDRQPLIDWVNDVLSGSNKLFSIPLSYSRNSKYAMGINKSWLEKKTGVHRKVANNEPHIFALLDSVIEAMVDAEIVILGQSSEANDVRRRILDWYRKLTHEEKLNVAMHRGLVSKKHNLSHIPSLSKNVNTEAVSTVLESISKELRALRPNDRKSYYRNIKPKHNRADNSLTSCIPIVFNEQDKNQVRRQRSEDYEKPIIKWLKHAIKKPDYLWRIEIDTHRTKPSAELTYIVKSNWIRKALGLNVGTYQRHRNLINTVIPEMVKHGVIIVGENAYNINSRRKVYLWFYSLSPSQKREIPTRNNKVSRKYLFQKIGIRVETAPLVKNALDDIERQLANIGVLEYGDTFVSNSDRIELRDKSFISERNKKAREWDRLSEITLDNVGALQEPTNEMPFIQLKQLFARCLIDVSTYSSRRNVIDAYERYVDFVKCTQGNAPVFLSEYLNSYSFTYFRQYQERLIEDRNISPGYANTILSNVRKAFDITNDIEGLQIPSILHEQGFEVIRTTDTYKPFSDGDRLKIDAQIKEDIKDRRRYLAPYEMSGLGRNPFDNNNYVVRGMATEENARWVFENKLNCEVVLYSKSLAHGSLELSFIKLLRALSGDEEYHGVYAKWGIASKLNLDFFLPYFLRLMQVTGLNADSICGLEINDYVHNHPITGRSCLRYWKERSDGEKEYHLDIFEAKLSWLTAKQSNEIKSIFEEVESLTERLRKEAPEELKQRLFIYKVGNNDVTAFTIQKLFAPIKRYKEKLDVEQFNVARFRPTFVSELIELGVSLREIQLLLGHANIETTMSYLDKLDFNKRARERIREKLEKIHKHSFPSNTQKLEINKRTGKNKEVVIFKTPLASCRNIFDPPEIIRNLPTYVPGKPCATYNKCLSCDNVIITSSHLPELFAMQRDYLEISQRSRLGDTPHGRVIEENILLLNEILDPEQSDFSKDELEVGRQLSRHIETSILVDGVIS